LKPIGWVHCFFVSLVQASQRSLPIPASETLERMFPESTRFLSWICGKFLQGHLHPRERQALRLVAILGTNPCWWNCLQAVNPVRRNRAAAHDSTFSFLKRLITVVKSLSHVRESTGSTTL